MLRDFDTLVSVNRWVLSSFAHIRFVRHLLHHLRPLLEYRTISIDHPGEEALNHTHLRPLRLDTADIRSPDHSCSIPLLWTPIHQIIRSSSLHTMVHHRLAYHLVHAFARVPVQERLATKHRRKLLRDTLEQLLNRRAVAYQHRTPLPISSLPSGLTDEGRRHLQTTRWDIAHRRLHVVGNPFHEIRWVLVLHVQHLLIHFFHRHATTKYRCYGQVATVSWITGSHHVLGIEHLLRQLGHRECTVLLRTTRCQRGKAWHEEVQARKRDHVDRQFSEIGVQLTWKAKTGGHTRHRGRDEMIQIAIGGCCQLQRAKADVVQRFVVDAVGLVSVLDQLMNGESGVVGLNDSVRHFGRWDDAEGHHDAYREERDRGVGWSSEGGRDWRSGYSSRILEMSRVPIPDPVPPPSECVSWNPWRQSQDSASFRTTSKTESTSSAPSV